MKIENKFLAPLVIPFLVLGVIRAMSWVAGARWSEPGAAVFASVILSLFLLIFIWVGQVDLGSFYIGKSNKGEDK